MKKLISMILCMMMFVSVLPLSSMAQTDETAIDEAFESSLKLVSAINRNFSLDIPAENAMSRGDFLRLALGLYGIDLPAKDVKFTDVPDDLKPFIAYAIDTGMIDDGVKFYPDNPVSYELALRIAVVMTGYTPYALTGGYIIAAGRADLTDGVDGTEMTVRNCVVLLANVLNTNVMVQSMYGDDKAQYEISNQTFLDMHHNIVYSEGIVRANMYTSLTSAQGAMADNYIVIGNEEFKSTDSSLLGYNVRAYYDKDSRGIVTMYKLENTEVSVNEVFDYDGNSLKYYDSNDKECKINLDESYQFIYNGKAYMHADFEDYFNITEGEFTFIDNNGDRSFDVVFCWDYRFMYVKYVDLFNWRIFDNNNDAYVDLSGDECKYEVFYQYKYAQEKVDLADISDNSVITYCLSNDGKYCRIYITEANVTGKITETNADEKIVKIGDEFYEYNSYFEKYYINYIGKSATFSISYDGKLMTASGMDSGSLSYGWLADAALDIDGLNKCLYIKIYTQEGKLSIFEAADKIMVDGDKLDYTKAYEKVLESYVQGGIYDRLIRYSLNDEGKVSVIDTAETATSASDFRKVREDNNRLTKYYHDKYAFLNSTTSFAKSFRVSSSTLIFFIPGNAEARDDERNYSRDAYSTYFEDFESYTVAAYDLNKSGVASCLVYSSTESTSSSANLATSALFIKGRTVYFPEEGETKKVYEIFQGGTYKSCTGYTAEVEAVMDTAEPGDVMRITANSQNEIIGAILDYDVSAGEFVSTPSDKNRVEYFKGYLDGYDGSNMNLVADMDAESIDEVLIDDYYHINTSRGSEIFVTVIKDKNNKVTSIEPNFIDPDSVLGFSDVGSGADTVLIRRRADAPGLAVVYRFVTR